MPPKRKRRTRRIIMMRRRKRGTRRGYRRVTPKPMVRKRKKNYPIGPVKKKKRRQMKFKRVNRVIIPRRIRRRFYPIGL